MKAIGAITTVLGIFILGPIWGGYILSILWGWFLVPAFHIPSISIALAIGLSVIVHMLTNESSSTDSSSKDKGVAEVLVHAFTYSFVSPLVALIIGAIVHTFL